jgi:DNA-binding transcriptional regulator LsrR (DeoR family)
VSVDDYSPLMSHLARLYYVEGLTKQEIGDRLGMSRFKVARLLDQARELGVVRFDIAEPLAVDTEAAETLARCFGLDLAVVAAESDDPAALARAAAAWIPDLLPADESVGVGWGATLGQIAELLPALDGSRPVVQICGAIPGLERGTGPTELAMRFAERLGGPLYPLAAPALTGRAAHRELLGNEVLRPTLDEFDRLGAALVGIGPAEAFPGAPAEAAGHILASLFDEDGAPVAGAGGHALAMSGEQLRATRLIAVAGGAGKECAILGALRSGLVDVLVTDAARAGYALAAATAGAAHA